MDIKLVEMVRKVYPFGNSVFKFIEFFLTIEYFSN